LVKIFSKKINMNLIQEINNVLNKTDEGIWKIHKTDSKFELTINNWDFHISEIDEIDFFRDKNNVTQEILNNHLWKWNGFYKFVNYIHTNREYKNKFLEDFRIALLNSNK